MVTWIKTIGHFNFLASLFLMGSSVIAIAKGESSPKSTRLLSTQIVLERSDQVEGLRKSAGNWRIFGEAISAKQHCNEETLSNPDQVEAFTVKGREDVLVVLCSGTVDGDANAVVVFVKGKHVTNRKIMPKSSSSRITDAVLKKVVGEILSAGK